MFFLAVLLDVKFSSTCLHYFVSCRITILQSSSTQDRGDTFQSRLMVVGQAAAITEGMKRGLGRRPVKVYSSVVFCSQWCTIKALVTSQTGML